MTKRITLPPDCATREELWAWIENVTPLIEEFNSCVDEDVDRAKALGLRSGAQTRLFAMLHRRQGQCVSKGALYQCSGISEGSLNVYVYHVRATLARHGYRIESVRSTGYVLYPPAEASTEMAA